ncbi:Uma2 family endonuclease [soil metagenome]
MAVSAVAAPTRVTLAEFQRMDLDDHAELILGQIHEPMPESLRHLKAAWRLARSLEALYPEQWVVRDASLPIPEDGEPRPDTIVFKQAFDAYPDLGVYDARDVLLVAEVCLSSHHCDYELKEIQYALGYIPEYWIIDLDKNLVEVRTEPQRWGYARRAVYEPGETVNGLSVAELLGPDPEKPSQPNG